MSGVSCPNCGGALSWVSERFFCPKCSSFPKVQVSDWGAFFDDFDLVCPFCGSSLDFIEQYERLFCSKCRKYPDKGALIRREPGSRCVHCGEAVPLSQGFCPSCGARLLPTTAVFEPPNAKPITDPIDQAKSPEPFLANPIQIERSASSPTIANRQNIELRQTEHPRTEASAQANGVCPSCGATVSPGVSFCGSCGSPLILKPIASPPKFCGECGAQLGTGAQFCKACGTKVTK